MTPRPRTRTLAGPVTVISPDTPTGKNGWTRRQAIEMRDSGYSVQQVWRITGIRLPERPSQP